MAIEVAGPVRLELDPPQPVVHVESGAVANVALRVRTRDHSLAGFGFDVRVRAVDEPGLTTHTAARFIQPLEHGKPEEHDGHDD
jgi:hypothetical protein